VVVNDRLVVPEGQRRAMRRRARNADAHVVQREWVCDSIKRSKLQEEAKYVPLFAPPPPPLPLPPPVDEEPPAAATAGSARRALELQREGTPPREDSQPAAAAEEPGAALPLGEGVLHDAFGVPGLLFLEVAMSADEERALSSDPTLFPAHGRPLYKTKDRLVAADLHNPRRFSETLTAVAERVRQSFDLLGESHSKVSGASSRFPAQCGSTQCTASSTRGRRAPCLFTRTRSTPGRVVAGNAPARPV
jgi:hypothetical protein